MKLTAALLTLTLAATAAAQTPSQSVSSYLTAPDRSALLASQPPIAFSTPATASSQTITVDPAKTYQTIDGFGFALTGGSAQLLMQMDPAKRAALLHELFAPTGDGIGVSYLRLSIGSSDMNTTSSPTTTSPPARPTSPWPSSPSSPTGPTSSPS